MPLAPFTGPSYVYRSVSFDGQRSVNLYPVKSETGTSKAITGMQGTPGLQAFIMLPEFPIRGSWETNGRVFWVAGNKLFETYADGTYIQRGQLNTSTGTVSMSDNGLQVITVDGPDGYIFTLATNVFTLIVSPGWLGATTVTYLDGYFVLNKPQSQVYFISGLYDGTTYDPLEFASAEGSPDNLVAVKTVHKQVWLFGTSTVQVVFNAGGAQFPLASIQDAFIEYGCAAPYSVANNANTVFWLGQDNQGAGMVWMANGYQPQRISTHAVEFAIQQYAAAGSLSDAVGYCYQEDGHYWYILNFTSANTTWAYDVELEQWHERAYFSEGVFSRARGQHHIYAYNMHLVGDYQSGIIYQQSLDFLDDNGQEIRRLRTFPHYADDLEYMYYHRLQIDMQTAVGISGTSGTGGTGGAFSSGFSSGFSVGTGDGAEDPDVDPQIMLQWSNDGGYVYSSEVWVDAGRIGEYKTRVLWRRLGRARDRVFRVTFTGRCKVFFIAAHIEVEKGTQ